MPGTGTIIGGGQVPGMTLRAWALFTFGGTILKGNGVSAAVKNSSGNYTLTLSQALPDVNAVVKTDPQWAYGSVPPVIASGYQIVSTTSLNVFTYQGGTIADYPVIYVAIYA